MATIGCILKISGNISLFFLCILSSSKIVARIYIALIMLKRILFFHTDNVTVFNTRNVFNENKE